MRLKTEEKRQQIIDVAGALFLEKGYDGISMSEIADKVGGSKATIYGYFSGKDDIFLAAMLGHAGKMAEKAFSVLLRDMDFEEKLKLFGVSYLSFILSEEMIEMKRAVIAQVSKEEIGKQLYNCGLKQGWGQVAALLEASMGPKGKLKKADSWLAAMQLKALFEADLYTRRILGVDKRLNKKILPAAVDNALSVFWSHYRK